MEVERSNGWQAGGGTTALGIIGTALGGLATVAGGSSLLTGNGLLGGNGNTIQRENTELRAEVAKLKSEKYTDAHVLDLGTKLATVDAQLHAVDDKLDKAITQNAADIACNREIMTRDLEIAKKQAAIDALMLENKLMGQINAVASNASAGIQANAIGIQGNSDAIRCLKNTVDGITRTAVPRSAICDFSTCMTGCCPQAQQ